MPTRPHRSSNTDFDALDAAISKLLSIAPQRREALFEAEAVRTAALRITHRRAGSSPGESAQATVMERMQALRRAGRIDFDRSTSRWTISSP